ncbi:hypothetical protein D4R86_04755 [bacterium]|nr:MAG: hypothetical protein D4R86_04755 [bacterium]
MHSYGQEVLIGNKGDRDIKAEIIGICVRPSHISYEVSWWKDQTKNTIWLLDNEFIISDNSKKTTLGFKNG